MFNGTLMKLQIFSNSALGLKVMDVVFSTSFFSFYKILSPIFDFIICFLSVRFTNRREEAEREG